jgi:predicted regulator of Ras-like GTPase activity (Roadblock/LC7/MglB family)
MQGELLADLAAESGIDVVTIVDSAGFAILAHPIVDDAERLAANVIALISQAETRPQDDTKQQDSQRQPNATVNTALTLIAQDGNILAFPLPGGHYLALQSDHRASLGRIRSRGEEIAARISDLMESEN